MQFFKQLTDPALKRLYKFVLKRLIGRFLAEDEIDLDQLDVHLRAGRLELCDLLLDAAVLNAELCEAHGLPFRVKKGYLGSVRVTISYANIMSESCLVEIDDVEIVLVPARDMAEDAAQDDDDPAVSATTIQAPPATAAATRAPATSTATATAQDKVGARQETHMDEISQEGLDFVASWIEQVTSKIKVTLSNICLRLETGERWQGTDVAMLLKLEWAQFTDESASEVASVYGHANVEQSMHQSMAASSLFGISQKGIKFRGISMDLSLPAEEGSAEEDVVLHSLLASDSARQCYVQVKLSHYEALEAPAADIDLFLHSIRVVLQPQHFEHLGTLMDAFEDDPSSRAAQPHPKRFSSHANSMYASVCDSRPQWLQDDDQQQTGVNDGGIMLSMREFQRIEQLLQQYHRTHEELRAMKRKIESETAGADFPYPMPRRPSIAESVESAGLSDLEDEDFFECETGAESLSGNLHVGGSNLMSQSMYASALYAPEDDTPTGRSTESLRSTTRQRSSRNLRNRMKIHLLECDVAILYDDLPDHGTEDTEHEASNVSSSTKSQRKQPRSLPSLTDQERLEFNLQDVICSALLYPSYVSTSFTVGTFAIVEKTLARMSTDIVEESIMLSTSILQFVDYVPSSGRKVHLSANLSAHIRIDFTPTDDKAVESLAVQVSAQPILLEWDMYILDRAHRLLKILEESSAAKQRKLAASPPPPTAAFVQKLDVNTECVEITLRFPMVTSDLVRFGPSSKRGLSEDKLVVMLDGVKAQSYANVHGESVDESASSLPWLSEFFVNFDRADVVLLCAKDGNQRSGEMVKFDLAHAEGNPTAGNVCKLRIRTQIPTTEQIKRAIDAKHCLSQDSLENSDTAFQEEKTGEDNDGGHVGSNGWSPDARLRATSFENAAAYAALFDLNIDIPVSSIVLAKPCYDRLLILFDALLMINPIDINGHNQLMASAAYRNRLVPSYMSVTVLLSDGSVRFLCGEVSALTSFIYHLKFQDLRVFQVSQWLGQLSSRLHVAVQDMSLLEECCTSNRVVPVLYKNPIGVNDVPILFVGVDTIDQTQEMREIRVELHVSQLNHRYEASSLWPVLMANFFVLEYPLPIIPLDSAGMGDAEFSELWNEVCSEAFETVKLAAPSKTTFTKLYVSFYDAVVDYAPTTLSSRVIIMLGRVGVSSNVVSGALIQGYKITIRDAELYLTPEGPSYDEFDYHILGRELLKRTTKKNVEFMIDQPNRNTLTMTYPSLLMFLTKHNFLQMMTMDCVDVFLRAIVPTEQGREGSVGESEQKSLAMSLGSPELAAELTLGTANIYACFDSFNSLIELVSVWTEQLATDGEPRDTTAYVGLDRVKDVSSVSVVTNVGPTLAHSLPTEDASVRETADIQLGDKPPTRSVESESDYASNTVNFSDGVDVLAQIDENAFGSGIRMYPGNHIPTDTEARLLQTRLDELQKEKDRMVHGATPPLGVDQLFATNLAEKSEHFESYQRARPRVRINELVIEDYYAGRGKSQESKTSGVPFLSSDEDTGLASLDNPWFSSPSRKGAHQDELYPEEQAARWLPADAINQAAAVYSSTPSPRFDAIRDDTMLSYQIKSDIARKNDEEKKRSLFDEMSDVSKLGYGHDSSSKFVPSSSQQMWPAPRSRASSGDDTSLQTGDIDDDHPLSMSMFGTGADEGTEVELDFALDQDMQSRFDRLMDIESSDGVADDDVEGFEEDFEMGGQRLKTISQSVAKVDLSLRRDLLSRPQPSAPMRIPARTKSVSTMSEGSSTAPSAGPSIISPPDEPTARWFYDDNLGDDKPREGPPSRIFPHHVEIPIGGAAASLSFGEKECAEAIRSIARENTDSNVRPSSPFVIRHILLRDFNICMRFFGGSDWSTDARGAPTLHHRHGDNSVPTETANGPPKRSTGGDKKEKLLDALLDDYVPSPGGDLFGIESSDAIFATSRSAPAASSMNPSNPRLRHDVLLNKTPQIRKRSLKSGRKTEEMLELVITRIQLRVDVFNEAECQPLSSNIVVALGDLEILDCISTSQIRKIICYWKSEASHPRESGSSMVHAHLMTVRPGPNLCEEHRLKVKILPLRVNLDQEVVNFLRQFVPPDDPGRGVSRTASESDPGDQATDLLGTELAPLTGNAPSVTETSVSLGGWFFQSIEIRPCKIKIDYRPNRVDFQALRAGDYLEVINLFVLEGMELVLRRVKASGIDGWLQLGEHVLLSWVNDISRHQIHKCVASVTIPPLRSFANIGSGAADLILLPMEHYGKDRRIVRGIKKGAKSFLKSVTIETLNTVSKVAQGTQALLEHADDVVSSTASRKKQIKYRQPGSRIARNSKRMGGGGIRSAQDNGGIGSRQYLAQQPSNATEGLYQAYDSLSREFHVAAKTIVAVPLVEYKKTGSQGYVRSVIRAVPVAVLRPMIGATEAMSKAVIGVRNAVDPELKEDVENKFKNFRTI